MILKLHCILLVVNILYISFAKCDSDDYQKDNMLGIDTVHKVKIDKDTIINRNMKLDRKNKLKSAPHHALKEAEDNPPDWSYEAIPNDIQYHAFEFKRNMSICLKEVQKNDRRAVKRLSPMRESPVHEKCLTACVLKMAGVIDNMKVNRDNLISLEGKFYAKDTKVMKKLEKNLDLCIEMSSHAEGECNLAAQLNDCTNGLMAANKHKLTVKY